MSKAFACDTLANNAVRSTLNYSLPYVVIVLFNFHERILNDILKTMKIAARKISELEKSVFCSTMR